MSLDYLYWIFDETKCDTLDPLNDEQFSEFIVLLNEHKLIIRFYKKVELVKPSWINLKQKFIIKLLYNTQNGNISKKQLAMTELSEHAKKKNIEYVIVKGLTSYFITGDVNNQRDSNDIDILCKNHHDLINLLLDLGYTKVEKKYSDHEIVSMLRNDVEFDIHSYIPLFRYHPGINENVVSIKNTSRTWFFSEREENYSSKIDFNDIHPYVHNGINFPDISMHTLIICINAFRNYVNGSYHPTSGIYLSDLFEIKSLVNHSDFNFVTLHKLIKKYSAEDAVSFMSVLLQHIFNISLIENEKELCRFPYKLSGLGVWALPKSFNCIVSRSFDDLNYGLYPVLASNREDVIYNDLKYFNSHIPDYIKEVRISKTNEMVTIRIILPRLVPWVNECFDLRIAEDITYEWYYNERKPESICLDDGIETNYIIYEKIYAVVLNIPKTVLENNSLTLSINRWGGIGVSVTYIPIYLSEVKNIVVK